MATITPQQPPDRPDVSIQRPTPPLDTADVDMTDASPAKTPLADTTVSENLPDHPPPTDKLAATTTEAIPETQLSTPPRNEEPQTPSTTTTRRKGGKVTFSSVTYSQAAFDYDDVNGRPSPTLPPSRTLKAIKGILKASPVPNHVDSRQGCSLRVLLDEVLTQLGQPDKVARVDGYSTLTASIKRCFDIPERMALNERMGTILHFIQRDMQTPPSKEPINHSLVVQSLGLLNTMLLYPGLIVSSHSDFGVFIVEFTIGAFEERRIPKEVIRNLMQTMHTQNFAARVWTSERVRRLVRALRDMEKHIQSSKVCMFRSRIFKRLVKQCPSHMMVHVDWLPCLFTDMISGVAEVRAAAIDFGYDAALGMGMEKDVSAKVIILLATVDSVNNKTYVEFYAAKLLEQFQKPAVGEEAPANTGPKFKDPEAVSKIWTIVTLFLRSMPPEKWPSLRTWLNVIPPCLNSSNLACRLEANVAWSRYLYVSHLHEKYFGKMLSTAVVYTFERQLSRRILGNENQTPFRKAVLGGVCTLFYYTFGPNTKTHMHERYWDQTVPLLHLMTKEGGHPDLGKTAHDILLSLLDSRNRKLYNEELVLSSAKFAKASDIPALDIWWVRKNIPRIHGILNPIVHQQVLKLADMSSTTYKLCDRVSMAVCSLAAKEIKVSPETVEYARMVINAFKELWQKGVPERTEEAPVDDLPAEELWLDGVCNYIMILIDGLGPLPFLEPVSNDSSQSLVLASPSPRGRVPALGSTNCLEMLVEIISLCPKGVSSTAKYFEILDTIIHPFLVKETVLPLTKLLRARLVDLAPSEVTHCFYNCVVRASLDTVTNSTEKPSGREYKELISSLIVGLRYCPDLPWTEWNGTLTRLTQHITENISSVGVAIAVVEPLSRALVQDLSSEETVSSNCVLAALTAIKLAMYPADAANAAVARKLLSNGQVAGGNSLDVFDDLYKLVVRLCCRAYADHKEGGDRFPVMLLRELKSFLERPPAVLKMSVLAAVQDGLAVWLRDERGIVQGKIVSSLKQLVITMTSILFSNTPEYAQLQTMEPLFVAALESPVVECVNLFVEAWNKAFAEVTTTSYPSKLHRTLSSIRSRIDITVPGLENGTQDVKLDEFRQSQTFEADGESMDIDQAEDVDELPVHSSKEPVSSVSPSLDSPVVIPSSVPIPRARHDDSQMAFIPIEAPETEDPETQVLTDHQQEVRDRQRQEAKLLPSDLRPNLESQQLEPELLPAIPPPISEEPATPGKQNPQESPSTPPTARSFESYLSQTPTPVRTTQVDMLNQEMSEVPSSPIERSSVSRFPLVTSDNASTPAREDWPEFSSPVNSSPIKPLRLTRSKRRSSRQNSQEPVQQDSLDEVQSIPETQDGSAENDTPDEELPTQSDRVTRSTGRSVRRSILDLPPLQMTTRSAARGSQEIAFSDPPSPASSPLKRKSRSVERGRSSARRTTSPEPTVESSGGRTRASRRSSGVLETPSHNHAARRLKKEAENPVATPVPRTRRSTRASSQNDDADAGRSSPVSDGGLVGEDGEDIDGTSLVVTRSGGKRKRSDMKDTPMPRKRTRTRTRRRSTKQAVKDEDVVPESQELEQDSKVSMLDVPVGDEEDEVKMPSSPLSELSEGDTLLSSRVTTQSMDIDSVPETQREQSPMDEPTSQLLSEARLRNHRQNLPIHSPRVKKEADVKETDLDAILRHIRAATKLLKECDFAISGAEASVTDEAALELKRALLEAEERGGRR